MPNSNPQLPPGVAERIAALEARIARMEAFVGLENEPDQNRLDRTARGRSASTDDLEFEVGQNWFARVGIIALAVGGGFMLTLPHAEFPAAVPGMAGLATAAILYALAHFGHRTFALVSSYLRGAAMALFYCAVLRLFYFGEQQVLTVRPTGSALLLVVASTLNIVIAWHRRSPWLMGLALLTAYATPVAVGHASFVLVALVALAALVVAIAARACSRALFPVGVFLSHATYLLWAAGDPVIGHPYRWASVPSFAPLCLLVTVTLFGLAPLFWPKGRADEIESTLGALINCGLGYGGFLVHSYAVGTPHFAALHVFASLVYLWIAALLWLRDESQIATFLYAMCGYAALTFAIIHLTDVPNVFVWLSVESVLVVATAIWFQSRFIIVANFLIYAAVVLGYVFLNERESGVSLGFGFVALASARILNWQRHRLALRTDLMRNAYLLSAFVVFPFALYHLAPARFVPLTWVGLAVLYYGLNVVIRNQKYRWMAHATLLLTAGYLVIPKHPGLTPSYRIASFLALGATFIVVSLSFTRSRQRLRASAAAVQRPDGSAADAADRGTSKE